MRTPSNPVRVSFILTVETSPSRCALRRDTLSFREGACFSNTGAGVIVVPVRLPAVSRGTTVSSPAPASTHTGGCWGL